MIEANLHETPKYGGWMESKGPRYCPSIEDKVVRFKDKPSHQVRHLHDVARHESPLQLAMHTAMLAISSSVVWLRYRL